MRITIILLIICFILFPYCETRKRRKKLNHAGTACTGSCAYGKIMSRRKPHILNPRRSILIDDENIEGTNSNKKINNKKITRKVHLRRKKINSSHDDDFSNDDGRNHRKVISRDGFKPKRNKLVQKPKANNDEDRRTTEKKKKVSEPLISGGSWFSEHPYIAYPFTIIGGLSAVIILCGIYCVLCVFFVYCFRLLIPESVGRNRGKTVYL